MSNCCGSTCESKTETLKCECPVCNQGALPVSKKTMMQHIKDVWCYKLREELYYFCRTENCDVVYFTKHGEILHKTDIRTRIGIKEQDDSALICYCFGVNKTAAATNKVVKEFVVRQTKELNCACETANPSGRCCLKDFPKFKS